MYQLLKAKSKNFKEPCYIDSQPYEHEFLKKGLVKALHLIAISSDDLMKENVRIYLDGSIRYDLHELLKVNVPMHFDEIQNWCEEIFAGHQFLILINKVEKWYDPIAQRFSKEFYDLNDELDKTPTHLEATYFISNSNFTPFGAHIDDISDAFHYNLGPDNREMLLWDVESYIKLRGSTAPLYNPRDILEYADCFPIEENKKFFLPARHYYHVGVNNSFNISFVLAFIKYETREYMQQAILMKSKELGIENNLIEKYIESHVNSATLNELDNTFGRFSLGEAITENIVNLFSKGGFREAPLSQRDVEIIDDQTKIKRKEPFQAFTLVQDNQLSIFVRGVKIKLPNHEIITLLIEEINSSQKLEVKVITEKYKNQLSKEVIYKILSLLHKYNLIEMMQYE